MDHKFLFVVLSSLMLFSCTTDRSPFVAHSYGDQKATNLPMAKSRSVNARILNERLQELTNEAASIENQMSVLLARLNRLRDEISGYDVTRIDVLENTVVKPAEAEPQVILPVPERPKPAQAVKPDVQKPTVKKQPTKLSGNGVVNVRVGAHSDKTRMVFDINGTAKHTMNYDAEAGVVTIAMPETQWSAANSKTFKNTQISGYEAKESGEGTIVAIAVKNTSDVKTMILSKPNRLVIDLIK
jgi:hypothetical protein